MKVLLIDLDSKIPNLAIMKLSMWHKSHNDQVVFCKGIPEFKEENIVQVKVSVVFKWSLPLCQKIENMYPGIVVIGGSGYDVHVKLPEEVEDMVPDRSIYPGCTFVQVFTTRGCFRRCKFCIVPEKEGNLTLWHHPAMVFDPLIKEIMIMDNNWLANKEWFMETSEWIIQKKLKVREHGMDIRILDNDRAKQLKRLKWASPLHFAFDSDADQDAVERGIELLKEHGINVRTNVRFYVYVDSDDEYDSGVRRCRWLKEHGTMPFVMFNMDRQRTQRIKNLQRWAALAWIFWKCDIDEYKVGL
jgi:hypothetical protein